MTQVTIREARLQRQPPMTQEALALEVGVDQAYVSLVERLLRNPSDAIKQRFAMALGYSLSALVFAGSSAHPLSAAKDLTVSSSQVA